MTASTPNDIHRLFAERFSSGDLDGMMELYDPEAIFITQSGEVAAGADAIREVLGGVPPTRRDVRAGAWARDPS